MTMPPDLPAVFEVDLVTPDIGVDIADPPVIEVSYVEPAVFAVISPGPAGPVGPAGDGGFTYTQATAASTWIIPNTLGRKPASVTVWMNDELVETEIAVSPDGSTITVTFGQPVTGRAEII